VEAVVTASQLAAAMEDALTARAEAEASAAAAAAATVRARELSGALDDTATAAGREGLGVSGAVELRREVAETRAELDAAKRAAELTTREARRWEETRGDLEATVGGLERQLADAKGTLHRSQEAERKHLQQLAGAVSEEKHRAEMEIAAAAEDEVARLRAEVIRAEDRAASAETELSRKTAGTATRDAELTQLRAAVRDMERRSDAQAALGRANQEVVRLKGGGAQLKHQVQVAEAEADRLHGDCLRLHRRLQAQEGRLFGLREDARGLMQAQEAALARMEAALAGRVDPAQAEKWERALSDLRRGAVRREALLQSAQKTLRGAVERADAAEGELTALRRLERLANALDADVTLREVRSQGEELLQAKLTAARADRAENAATERAAYLESREGEREQHLCKVEEAAMRDKQVGDTRADDLQRRVRALQRELLEVRHQAGDTGGATAGATAGAGLDSLAIVNSGGGGESFTARGSSSADVPVPLPRRRANAEALAAVGAAAAVGAGAASLETQRLVLQQIEAIRALKLRAAEAERRAAEVGAEVRAAQDAAVNAEADRDALQRRLDTQLALAGIGSSGGGGAGGDGEESAVAQVTAVAQATIARLQELVAEKNAALTRAQAAMAELRSSALGKQNEDRRTIEQLNDLLFKQDQAEIKGMREALESSGGGGGRDGRDDGDGGGGRFGSKSHDQLVSLLAEREQAVEVLTSRFEQQRTRHDGAEARLQERP
jgi:centrosomal protein CEP290